MTIAIEVEDGHAGAHDFRKPVSAVESGLVDEHDSALTGHIREGDGGGRRREDEEKARQDEMWRYGAADSVKHRAIIHHGSVTHPVPLGSGPRPRTIKARIDRITLGNPQYK